MRFLTYPRFQQVFKIVYGPVASPSGIPTSPLLSPKPPFSPPRYALVHTIKQKLDELLRSPTPSHVTTETRSKAICQYYNNLIPEDKTLFLKTLAKDYGVNQHEAVHLANNLIQCQDRGSAVFIRATERLRHVLQPHYYHMFTDIGHLEKGVKFLVDMRGDILNQLSANSPESDNPHLRALNASLRDLLALWFAVGFLNLQRITWYSPCDLMQKISEYEAVHPIKNWTDLKRRVGPYRRCFVFTHDSMPREPVVVLHTALTDDISNSIQSIVQHPRITGDLSVSSRVEALEDPSTISTAIFYSITSTQKGLQGIELGNYLIKSVVKELQSEFPRMTQFSSLSPIPGFKDWLIGELNTTIHMLENGEVPCHALFLEEELRSLHEVFGTTDKLLYESLRRVLHTNSWYQNEGMTAVLQTPLLRLCARYLYIEKRRAYALNPVANFHLRNGAIMWRINWLADTSPRGLSASCSLMVNYKYELNATEQNSKNYMETHSIRASQQVLDLVKKTPPGMTAEKSL